MTRLSVIVPGYWTPEVWWRRCLASIMRAIDTEDEIICVDDGDETGVSFLDEEVRCESRIRVIHRRNGGLSVARNTAMSTCRGAWITFVDSDDEVRVEVYARTLASMGKAQADIGLFGVQTIWVSEGLVKEDIPPCRDYGIPAPCDVRSFSSGCLLNYVCNKVYRKALLDGQRLRFTEKGMPCEDIIFNLECIMAGARWCTVDYVGYIYYRTGGTLLSCYRPFNGEGLRLGAETWHRYVIATHGADMFFKRLTECGEGTLLWAEWDNIWRLNSPYSMAGRLKFLRAHQAQMVESGAGWQGTLLRYSPALLLFAGSLYHIARRWLYIRPVRRWHIRRMYPQVKPWLERKEHK